MRKRKRKLKKEITITLYIMAAIAIIFVGVNFFSRKNDEKISNTESEAKIEGTSEIPSSIDDEKILKYLKDFQERSKEEPKYNNIIQAAPMYPEDVLRLLYSNPETIDFALNYDKTRMPGIFVKIDEECGDGKIPRLQQWDEKWGYSEYGDGIIAVNGCGPTALSMVASGLTGKRSITPIKVAKYSDSKGYHEANGTNWRLMYEGAKKFGIKGWKIDKTDKVFKEELEKGHPIICSMKPGDFTKEGHFIVIAGLKDGKFIVNDPNSIKRSEKLWTFKEIGWQVKACWAYSED